MKITKKIGMTSGCFDLFHYYHLRYLTECAKRCDYLIVLVDSDELVRQNKGKSTVICEDHRASIIKELKCVAQVRIMDSIAAFKSVAENVDVIFKNDTQIYGRALIGKEKTVIIPDIPGYHATDIKASIINKTKLC